MTELERYAARAAIAYAQTIELLLKTAIADAFSVDADIVPVVVPNALRPGATVYFPDSTRQQRIYL